MRICNKKRETRLREILEKEKSSKNIYKEGKDVEKNEETRESLI
jgi:hypothetical protein